MINRRPRHILSIVKNLTEAPASGIDGVPVRRAAARMSTSVILDQYGCIRACGQQIAALAGIAGQTLSGQPIKSLLPTLPFQRGTPGYNVAFAVFHANIRRHTVCKMAKGADAPVMVDVSLTILETAPVYLFKLDIRKRAGMSVPAPDAGARAQQQAIFRRCA